MNKIDVVLQEIGVNIFLGNFSINFHFGQTNFIDSDLQGKNPNII
jgi:hypothetical protein